MKRSIYIIMLLLAVQSVQGQLLTKLKSPGGLLSVAITLKDGKLFYTVTTNKTVLLRVSRLGLDLSDEQFGDHLSKASVSSSKQVTENYRTLTAKKSLIHYKANQQTVTVTNANGKVMQVIFRVSNDGVAYQYYFPWIGGETKTIIKEYSSYHFNNDAKAWLQPMSEAKTGWEHCHPSYEENYLQDIPVGTVAPLKSGWVYPALFKTGDQWVLVTEAGMDGTYCGTRLLNDSASAEYTIGFPDDREIFTGKGYLPQNNKPWHTPWRVMAVGSLKTIAESTLGTDLAPSSSLSDLSFVKPGKASWSWINSKDDNIVYAEQKKYIDYAADMHWQYCLVDADWDTKIGYDSIQLLVNYAAKKNIRLLLWYNSSGNWNTVKYHPKDLLLTHEGRVKEFSRLQQMGIKGIKADFFGGDGQSMIAYYIDILKDAAQYKLLVNFHGATLPRGWAKTYPHLLTTEAIYGMEMVTFEQRAADNEATHCALLPFTRNAFDPMDFTPMNLYKLTHSGIIRKTTSAFELALSVLFLSGIQHYAESPEGMAHMPDYVKTYLQSVPLYWDDIKFIDGFPGKYVVIARKSGTKWYISGINGEQSDKSVAIDLSFLENKKGYIIRSGKDGELFQKNKIDSVNNYNITMKGNDGFVMVFE